MKTIKNIKEFVSGVCNANFNLLDENLKDLSYGAQTLLAEVAVTQYAYDNDIKVYKKDMVLYCVLVLQKFGY